MKFLMFAVALPGIYLTTASYFIIRDNGLGYIEYDKEQEERLEKIQEHLNRKEGKDAEQNIKQSERELIDEQDK